MLNYAIKLVLMSFLVVLWLNPQVVGIWEAKKDLAYNSIVGDFYYYYENKENQE